MAPKAKTAKPAKKLSAPEKEAILKKKSEIQAKRDERRSKRKTDKALYPSDVKKVKTEIRLIKRNGGTIRFAKSLKNIRRLKRSQNALKTKLAVRTAKNAARKTAVQEAAAQAIKDGSNKLSIKKPSRKYSVVKMRSSYHTQLPMRKNVSKNTFGDQKGRKRTAALRSSLKPGTVVILLAGRHQCKKAVFLKQLRKTGLCLISGPYGVSGVPLRRMDQNYLIATSTRVQLPTGFKVPEHINDDYFRKARVVKKKVTSAEEDIFKTKRVTLKKKPSAGRKQDQAFVDKAIMKGIKSHQEGTTLRRYLKREFGLLGTRYAHDLKF